MINSAVVFIVYKRLETTIRVFNKIREASPKRLYLIADGPKLETDKQLCRQVRNYVEKNINWPCELVKVYSEENLGCAKRIQTGLNTVFKSEPMAIILEDDTLPDTTFFDFCEELLLHYKDNTQIGHISGCNPYHNSFKGLTSYYFSSIINIWGWATWKRSWENYDLMMSSWADENKSKFLETWCIDKTQRENIRKMFDLHCNNDDPWTWDYQWVYSCWKVNALGIIPNRNLVSNIGIGPNATNTRMNKSIDFYPAEIESSSFPLKHPKIEINHEFDNAYMRAGKPSIFRIIKNQIKSKFTLI